ncbi:MAG: O-methyltransferase [Clostridia bacterium]|nr:O-methyltransferase [Clostridia bacterium]
MKNPRKFWIVNEDVEKYIRNTLKSSSRFLMELEQYAEINNVPIMTKETKCLIEIIGWLQKPERILEIGTAIGYSSICFSNFLAADGSIETIEIDSDLALIARDNIKKADLAQVISVIVGEGTDVLTNIDKKYDMIFIDAAKGQYETFFDLCSPMINPGGIIISDNVLYRGMVARGETVPRRKKHLVERLDQFIKKVMEDDRFDSSLLSIGDGVLLSYRKDYDE